MRAAQLLGLNPSFILPFNLRTALSPNWTVSSSPHCADSFHSRLESSGGFFFPFFANQDSRSVFPKRLFCSLIEGKELEEPKEDMDKKLKEVLEISKVMELNIREVPVKSLISYTEVLAFYKIRNQFIFDESEKRLKRSMVSFSVEETIRILEAFSRAQCGSPLFFRLIEHKLGKQADQIECKQMISILRSFSRAQKISRSFIQKAILSASQKIKAAPIQERLDFLIVTGQSQKVLSSLFLSLLEPLWLTILQKGKGVTISEWAKCSFLFFSDFLIRNFRSSEEMQDFHEKVQNESDNIEKVIWESVSKDALTVDSFLDLMSILTFAREHKQSNEWTQKMVALFWKEMEELQSHLTPKEFRHGLGILLRHTGSDPLKREKIIQMIRRHLEENERDLSLEEINRHFLFLLKDPSLKVEAVSAFKLVENQALNRISDGSSWDIRSFLLLVPSLGTDGLYRQTVLEKAFAKIELETADNQGHWQVLDLLLSFEETPLEIKKKIEAKGFRTLTKD